MSEQSGRAKNSQSVDDEAIRGLYQQLLDHWNKRSATGMALLFAADGNLVGFDGSSLNGRAEIQSHLSDIFANHQTATYVAKVREVRFLTPEVVVLRGIAGMVPPGQSVLNPQVNATQTLVASRYQGEWRIDVFQNTPAAFHGRPELSEALTEELSRLLQPERVLHKS